nr:hypothetical protein [Tanacetum cinerariifolium]
MEHAITRWVIMCLCLLDYSGRVVHEVDIRRRFCSSRPPWWVTYGASFVLYVLRPVFYDEETKQEIKLHNFIKVANPFDISCEEEKPKENERPFLVRTPNVVTQPSDQVIVLTNVSDEQEVQIATLPPPVGETPVGVSASEKQKETTRSGLVKTPTPVSFVVSPLHSAVATTA